MKTTIRTILCAAIAILPIVSCQKSIDSENPVEPTNPTERGNGTIDISVNGLMGEYSQVDATKSELVNTIRVSWKGGETVYVYDGEKCLGSLVASLDENEDKYARLSTDGDQHKIMTPAAGTTKLTLVHSPMLTDAPSVSGGAVSISLAVQSGEKAPFVAYATLDYKGETTITGVVVPFKFATSVIKVNCTGLKPGTAITSATLSNVNTECKLTLFGDKAPVVAGGTNGTITRTGDAYFAASKVNSEGEAVFQIAVPALGTASGARVLTVAQGSDEVKDKNFSKKSIDPATSVNTVCRLVRLPAGALEGEFSVGPNDKVRFSKGNLWYGKVGEEAEPALHFETNQWESIPSFNNQKSGTMDPNHVSHFTWANTVEKAISEKDYDTDHLFCDEMHKQSVDGSAKIYFALSKEEWDYLLKTRTMLNNKNRYSAATKSGVIIDSNKYYGLFLYPDNYDGNEVGTTDGPDTWDDINDAGIVFLPAAGYRNGDAVSFGIIEPIQFFTLRGRYSTSSSRYVYDGIENRFYIDDIDICNDGAGTNSQQPGSGDSLRLVTDAQ